MPKGRPSPNSDKPAPERVAEATKYLAGKSVEIKAAVKELVDMISPLDAALAKFDLGVSAWFEISGNENYGRYWTREIGYAQVGNEWGIALKRTEGHYQAPEEDQFEEIWLFKDAPRWMQIEGVTKIPDLFETLIKRVEDTITKLKAKSVKAKELADALNAALAEIAASEE